MRSYGVIEVTRSSLVSVSFENKKGHRNWLRWCNKDPEVESTTRQFNNPSWKQWLRRDDEQDGDISQAKGKTVGIFGYGSL